MTPEQAKALCKQIVEEVKNGSLDLPELLLLSMHLNIVVAGAEEEFKSRTGGRGIKEVVH